MNKSWDEIAAWTIGIVLVASVFAFGMKTMIEREDTEIACNAKCSPFQAQVISQKCHCMNSEGHWVPVTN